MSSPSGNLRHRKHNTKKQSSAPPALVLEAEDASSFSKTKKKHDVPVETVGDDDDNIDDASSEDIHFDNVIPLTERPVYFRLDVAPFALVYLLCIHADSYHSSQQQQQQGAVGSSSVVTTVVFGLALLLHASLVLSAQWSVRAQVFVGYYQKEASLSRSSSSASSSMHAWTHAWVQSNDGSGIVPVQVVSVHVQVDGGGDDDSGSGDKDDVKTTTTAVCRFHDITLRCSTQQPDLDVTLWQQQQQQQQQTTASTTTSSLRFRRLHYPIAMPLTFYSLTWTGHSITSAIAASRVYGPNATTLQIPSWLSIFSKQLVQPFFLFQIFCVVLWMLDEYWYYAIYTLLALLVLEGTVAYQQWVALQRLHQTTSSSTSSRNYIWVCRPRNTKTTTTTSASSRDWMRISTLELVPGDVVFLTLNNNNTSNDNNHNKVPADLLLLQGTAVCDEALLTGESVPQLKRPVSEIISSTSTTNDDDGCLQQQQQLLDLQEHKESILFAGTNTLMLSRGEEDDDDPNAENGIGYLLPGAGQQDGVVAVVLRTAFDTAQGSLLRAMAHSSMNKSSNMHNNWDTFCFISILVACAIVAAVHVWNHSAHDETRNRLRLLLHVILIITSVVPPELPMELSLAITNSVAALMRHKRVYCTEHGAIPVAGQVNVCCFDKTGTLTSDLMRLKGVRLIPNDDENNNDIESEELILPCSAVDTAAAEVEDGGGVGSSGGEQMLPYPTLRIMAACHSLARTSIPTSSSSRKANNRVIGDPLEQVVLTHSGYEIIKNNFVAPIINYDEDKSLHIFHRFAFSSKLKRMTVLVTEGLAGTTVFALSKGAPETIKSLLKSVPANYTAIAEYHMKRGRRVLAMAYRQVGPIGRSNSNLRKYKDDRSAMECNLIFAGFLILDCPLKLDSKAVITELKKSRHVVVMITGDAILTATEVARQVGIVKAKKTYRIQARAGAATTTATASTAKSKLFQTSDVFESLECVPLFSTHANDDDDSNIAVQLSLSAIDRFSIMVKEGKACFCMTGDVLTKIATTALQKSSLDEKHALLHNATLSVLAHLVPLVSVFARHTPHQKEAIIAAFNRGPGCYTLMCGDGTNDVGALKRASVGISIISAPHVESKQRKATETIHRAKAEEKRERKSQKKKKNASSRRQASLEDSLDQLRRAQDELDHVELGDASVAAPFTSRAVSIKCCKDVIQQGRCTLVTMLSIYKILGINCLVNALVLSKLFLHGVKQGDRQLTVLGIAVAALFYFVTRAEPLSTLSVIRPPSSVLCWQALLSISCQFLIHATSILLATEAGLYFVDSYDPSLVPDGPFNPNVLNSCSFLLTCLATINTFAVNYRGRPFMADLRENKLLYRSLQVCYAVLVICALELFPPLNDLLQLTELPTSKDMGDDASAHRYHSLFQMIQAVDFRVFICGLMAVDTGLAFAVERFIVARFEGKE